MEPGKTIIAGLDLAIKFFTNKRVRVAGVGSMLFLNFLVTMANMWAEALLALLPFPIVCAIALRF